jgi:hypothetical protein
VGDREDGLAQSPSDQSNTCFLAESGLRGTCMDTSACAARGGHKSFPGHCSGPPNIECCASEPLVENNPPAPAGWKLVPQNRVSMPMTQWATMIANAPSAYPLGSTARQSFGGVEVMARIEWHSADSGHDFVHRGVTLYQRDCQPAVASAGM